MRTFFPLIGVVGRGRKKMGGWSGFAMIGLLREGEEQPLARRRRITIKKFKKEKENKRKG